MMRLRDLTSRASSSFRRRSSSSAISISHNFCCLFSLSGLHNLTPELSFVVCNFVSLDLSCCLAAGSRLLPQSTFVCANTKCVRYDTYTAGFTLVASKCRPSVQLYNIYIKKKSTILLLNLDETFWAGLDYRVGLVSGNGRADKVLSIREKGGWGLFGSWNRWIRVSSRKTK